MPLTNQVVSQQDQVHIQTQIQEYEQKDAMSTRVIDETTLRIYLPWVPDADLTVPLISASSPEHLTGSIVASQVEAINAQAPPLLLITH